MTNLCQASVQHHLYAERRIGNQRRASATTASVPRVHRFEYFAVAKECDVRVVLADHERRPKVVGDIRCRISCDVSVRITKTTLSTRSSHDTTRSTRNDEHDIRERQPAPVLAIEDVGRDQYAREALLGEVTVVVVPLNHAERLQPKAFTDATESKYAAECFDATDRRRR